MLDDEKNHRIPDEFWDLSSLIPRKNVHVPARRSVDAVEIHVSSPSAEREDTVIERMIPSKGAIPRREEYTEVVSSYLPQNSLLHEVTVKKRKNTYPFYEEFFCDVVRYRDVEGNPCEYVAFFSYSPQYNQLEARQLDYYFWWRSNARRGVFLKADYSYVLLYVYELLNLGSTVDVSESLHQLTALWNEYHMTMPSLNAKLATWICDFGLIHGLPPAENTGANLVRQMGVLKEYYIAMPNGDTASCVGALLKYCTAYDYHTSKFAKGDNLILFERHVPGALACAVEYFSEEGNMLSKLAGEDSVLTREAYAGAICSAREKYQISVRYCSFSRTNELRYLVGDIIKYAENKIRAGLGIKSRLSVYSLSSELQTVLDGYFERSAGQIKPATAKKKIKQEYDALYDLPLKPLSLSDARRIEQESWETTNELLEAFEDMAYEADAEQMAEAIAKPIAQVVGESAGEASEDSLACTLGELYPFAMAVLHQNLKEQRSVANSLGKLPETVVEQINQITMDLLGDILIEEINGCFEVIDCYRDVLDGGCV